ncbi:class I SAM-dependent methyltransferase [Bacillus timonensis]|nr:class I SAM-dependent methyltransferase [Bacillus timonensis]
MKYRQSGMPDEGMWETFFDTQKILQSLQVTHKIKKFIDIGCGYGTFLIPASKMISGIAIGIDLDREYLKLCDKRVSKDNIHNVQLVNGDISNNNDTSLDLLKGADYVSLFNILHCEEPLELMKCASSLLVDGGKIGVIHWKQEETPRGPSFDIRPSPESIMKWGEHGGLQVVKQIDLPPYHFGILFKK